MIDLTIEGTLSRDGVVQGICLWCGKESTSRAYAKGLGREVPVHVVCCMVIVRESRRWMEKGLASPRLLEYMERLESLARPYEIGPG